VLEHLLLVEEVALVTELVAQVAEQGGLISPLRRAAAILGRDSSSLPTQRRSAVEVADMPQSRLAQLTTVALPSARWVPVN
jgi:hypothetical protein